MSRIISCVLAIVALVYLCPSANAEIRLAGIFGEHMVLQRQKEIRIWGWADAGEEVFVQLGDNSASTQANAEGRWFVELPAMEAGGPYRLTAAANRETDKPPVLLKDVLIGEVWLCSGQSNMEWPVSATKNANQEIAAAKFPKIRHFNIAHRPSATPLDDIPSKWTVCSPETVPGYTATGYYFARKLHQELGIPIGLINSSWGGTRVEPWTPPNGFAQTPALQTIHRELQLRTPGSQLHQEKLTQHITATERWLETARSAVRENKPVTASPKFPSELLPVKGHQNPSMLYNGMIHGMVGIPMRGAIWYQGEANRADGMMYFEKKKALINGWRELWGQGDFPFYFVQIAPYQYGNDRADMLAELWEAQAEVLTLPNTSMVVVSDVGNLKDIHPRNKQAVGLRLANVAMKNQYGKTDLLVTGPTFQSMEIQDGKLAVKFSHAGNGLSSRDGKPIDWFEIIGKGTQFNKADVEIAGDTLILSSANVPNPVAVRFAWHKLAEPNLTNSAGLPGVPFRAGEVPTALDSVPGIEQYQLVYDLDLSKLGSEIKYGVDRSQNVESFDRVAYFMELRKGGQTPQHLFVSMNAFTDDVSKIGVPTFQSKSSFQQAVSAVDVHTNVDGVQQGRGLSGHIEFWPNNYHPAAAKGLGSKDMYDFDDTKVDPVNGYGSMQVHIPAAKQTLFSLNRWSQPSESDLGIGNSTGAHRDWTFSRNINQYTEKRLRIFVRPRSKR